MRNRPQNRKTGIDEVMDLTRVQNLISAVILTAALLFMTGCADKGSQAQKPQIDQKVKAPTTLKNIASDLEKIIAALEQKYKASSKSVWQQNGTKASEQSGSSKQGRQSQNSQQAQGENQQGQQTQSTGSENQAANWQIEVGSIKNIHQNWNQLEPEIVQAGLSISERESFEKALDALTLAVGKQKTDDSLIASIELYGQYANLVKAFQTAVPSEFYKVKYELMSAAAEAGLNDWEGAQKRITSINENWNHLKVKAEVKDETVLTRTEFAIQDMILALQSQEMDILLVKTEIAMNNLQNLEKEISSVQTIQS